MEGEVCGYTGEALAVFGSTSTETEVIATISPLVIAFYPGTEVSSRLDKNPRIGRRLRPVRK